MRKPGKGQLKQGARESRPADARRGQKRSDEERKRLHGAFARSPELTGKVAEATALYQRELASGGLRRPAAPRRNSATRKR